MLNPDAVVVVGTPGGDDASSAEDVVVGTCVVVDDTNDSVVIGISVVVEDVNVSVVVGTCDVVDDVNDSVVEYTVFVVYSSVIDGSGDVATIWEVVVVYEPGIVTVAGDGTGPRLEDEAST